MFYKNKKILITGGLGFLGSSLAISLVEQGADVTIIDNLDPLYGGNYFNINSIKGRVKIINADISNLNTIETIVSDQEYIFHFAAQVSYIDSINMPYHDLDINAKTTLQILETVRRNNPKVKIIFSSSRMVLGKILSSPYTEESPANPLSLYGIHKLTSEKYLLMYYQDFGIKSAIFRITNPYGPRQQIKHNKYSVPGWFLRCAIENKTIKIFGDGNQIRDYVFIDDIITSMLFCASNNESYGEIINMGSGISCAFKEMVKTVVDVVGNGTYINIPWPDNYERIETGDSIPDISKLKRLSGYSPSFNIRKGIELTFKYYQENWDKYVC